MLVHIWKTLHGKVPNDVGVRFRERSRLGIQAEVPSIVRASRLANQTKYGQSFAVYGPTLWNLLPSSLTSFDTMDKFKSELTKYLMTLPDEPPIAGYPRRNGNRLTDVVGQSTGGHQR